ncbi:assimilatory nitrite reductase subunit [Bacillus freudenreichii]|nr:assimilatory nitrite reductase subunit [Bacillus freudenreichii]
MSEAKTIIIIGGGIAGTHAAQTLRSEGHDGRIILFDRDSEIPYDRPPLSKEYMLGESVDRDILLMDPAAFEQLDIEMHLGTEITDFDIENKEVISDEGIRYGWDQLLLATGSKLRRLQVDGSHFENIFYLKTLNDAKKIKQSLSGISKIAIVGAGFIGAELASSCRKLGIDVTIIERAELPMSRILGEEMGRYFLDLHRSNSVELVTNDSIKEFYGSKNVERIVTANGKTIECQAVVIGIGVDANTSFTHQQLKADRGYVVDEFGETSIPGIFAAGDCAMWPYHGTHIHVEHWDHAVYHAQAVAKNMVAQEKDSYHRVPYFWSDQYGHRFQYIGHSKDWSKTVLRGHMEDGKFTYFYLDENNVIQAAMIVNDPRNVIPIRSLVAQQNAVDPELLADQSVSLKGSIASLHV